jgi:hypothetical protein
MKVEFDAEPAATWALGRDNQQVGWGLISACSTPAIQRSSASIGKRATLVLGRCVCQRRPNEILARTDFTARSADRAVVAVVRLVDQ